MFGPKRFTPKKPARSQSEVVQGRSEPPARRNLAFETILCEAMRTHKLVELRYKDDVSFRLYQPEGLVQGHTGNVRVDGVQLKNPNETGGDETAHRFTVGKITAIRLSPEDFRHPVRFDRQGASAGGRVICAA